MNKEGDLIGGGQKERESLAPYPVPIAGQVHNHTPTTPQGSPVPFSKIELLIFRDVQTCSFGIWFWRG